MSGDSRRSSTRGPSLGDRIRNAVDRAELFARTLRSTGLNKPVRPSQLVQFARGARHTKPGPHLAIMYHAASQPDREALVEYRRDGSVRRLSWAELDATINRLAHALVQRGVGASAAGRHVAVMLPNGGEYIMVQQALARIGGTAVQIGYRSKPAEIGFILDNATPAATIVQAEYLPAMRDARAATGKGGPMIVLAVVTSSKRARMTGTARSRPPIRRIHHGSPAARAPASSSTPPARPASPRAPTGHGAAPASTRSPT